LVHLFSPECRYISISEYKSPNFLNKAANVPRILCVATRDPPLYGLPIKSNSHSVNFKKGLPGREAQEFRVTWSGGYGAQGFFNAVNGYRIAILIVLI
jgi:hypothetical protein